MIDLYLLFAAAVGLPLLGAVEGRRRRRLDRRLAAELDELQVLLERQRALGEQLLAEWPPAVERGELERLETVREYCAQALEAWRVEPLDPERAREVATAELRLRESASLVEQTLSASASPQALPRLEELLGAFESRRCSAEDAQAHRLQRRGSTACQGRIVN